MIVGYIERSRYNAYLSGIKNGVAFNTLNNLLTFLEISLLNNNMEIEIIILELVGSSKKQTHNDGSFYLIDIIKEKILK